MKYIAAVYAYPQRKDLTLVLSRYESPFRDAVENGKDLSWVINNTGLIASEPVERIKIGHMDIKNSSLFLSAADLASVYQGDVTSTDTYALIRLHGDYMSTLSKRIEKAKFSF